MDFAATPAPHDHTLLKDLGRKIIFWPHNVAGRMDAQSME